MYLLHLDVLSPFQRGNAYTFEAPLLQIRNQPNHVRRKAGNTVVITLDVAILQEGFDETETSPRSPSRTHEAEHAFRRDSDFIEEFVDEELDIR